MALLKTARAHRERDWLMIVVMFWHGGRNSEVIHLTRDDVQDGFLILNRLKGSERTTQELVAHENPLLSERQPMIELALNTPSGRPLFKMCRQHFWRIVRKHAIAAGIPKHKAKTTVLKHTIGTLLVETMPLNKVQKRLGHKSLSSTGQYTKAKDADVDSIVVRAVDL